MALLNVIADIGGSFGYRLRPGPRARIGLARGRGSAMGSTGSSVAWLLIEGGSGEVALGKVTTAVDGRDDVFDSPGWSFLIGQDTPFAIRGHVRYLVAFRAWERARTSRVIAPDDVRHERRGRGMYERTVRTYLDQGPLLCGETLAQPGRWSSWPPHRHEHEEVRLFRFDAAKGFGVQGLLGDGGSRATIVRDGHVERIRDADHPAVASPAARMCYVWTLAGASQKLTPETGPHRRRVRAEDDPTR